MNESEYYADEFTDTDLDALATLGRISHLTNCRKAAGKPPIDWPPVWTKAIPAVDGHRTRGDDKGMDVKGGNHRSVEKTEQCPHSNGHKDAKHSGNATA